MMISVFDGVENIVGKEKMLVTSIFSFSNDVFKGLYFKVVKSRDCVVKGWSVPMMH